ncbi:MAG: cation diffusion facilitator family transporter [Planctomycetes bacterium]|nr:cation diffusion facilitator family transporter [Planctomycetota bacterium]
MSAGGSRKVVLMALGANFGIAVSKLVAAVFTGSGSMMAEAIHSFADCGNQGLLLLGAARSAKPANEHHPLGYGREAYFWAFLVAVVLFTLGGAFSVYEGVEKLRHPHELEHVGWAVGVLALSVVLEGMSFLAAWRAVAKVRRGRSLLSWARSTGDVDLLVVTFEDIAALAGLTLALVAVLAAWATGNTMYDAVGSIFVGLVLLTVAVFVGAQMRRLIVGFSAEPSTQEAVRGVWSEHGFDVLRMIAVWSGPGSVTVSLKVLPRDLSVNARALIDRMNAAESDVRRRVPEVTWQFVEPDIQD